MKQPDPFVTIKQPYGSRMCAAAVVAMAIGKDLTYVLNNGVMTPSGISVYMQVRHVLAMLGEHAILCGLPLVSLPKNMDGSEELELPFNLIGWPSIVTVPSEIENSTHVVFWDGYVVRDPNPKVPETTGLEQYEILELWPLCYIEEKEDG